jgi:flagellar hook assembly protein FlgD
VLPENILVNLSVFNVDGKLLRTLVDKTLSEGFKEASWDGKDTKGNQVGSGVYLYRLKAGKKTLTKKMVLLK